MNTSDPKVLTLPPHPPSAVNTVVLSRVGFVMGLGACATFYSVYSFPEGSSLAQVLAAIGSFAMLVIAFSLGLRAITGESKRNQFKAVVENYSRITGDKRYEPYVLPTHILQVSLLFTASMIASFLFPLISLFGGL